VTIAIYRGPDRGYSLTYNDVLWLARGFVGEAGEAKGACSKDEARWLFWTWMNRFLLMPAAKWNNWDFWELVYWHSQALSPKWDDPTDEGCLAHPSHCTPNKIARRARIRSKTQAQLEAAGVWQFALDAQAGKLSRPWGAALVYDFEACTQAKAGTKNVGENCFYRFDELPAWQKALVARGDRVEVWPSSMTLAKATGIAVAGILTGYCAWLAWDSRPRRRGRRR